MSVDEYRRTAEPTVKPSKPLALENPICIIRFGDYIVRYKESFLFLKKRKVT